MNAMERELLRLIRNIERRLDALERLAGRGPLEMADGAEEQLAPPWIIYYDNGEIAHGTTDSGQEASVGMEGYNDYVWGVVTTIDAKNHLLALDVETRVLSGDEVWIRVVDDGAGVTAIEHIGPNGPGTWHDLSSGARFDDLGHFVGTGSGT